MDPEELSPADYRALAELRYHIRQFLRFSEDAARQAGIEPAQHQALLALVGMPIGQLPTIGALAERLQIRHHSAVELVDRLVQAGLVERARDEEDHRQVLLSLTDAGRTIVHRLSLAHRVELKSIAPALVDALRSISGEQAATPGFDFNISHHLHSEGE